ncbi:hypothetical protein Tdes44962_MAKER00584 [Teratosphaeria destructans]|uniref:Uncharacterized protein n=1 Tax=Teratosphaeria destructans TaxID=418781 RepID=A0A9W7W0V5_9PEZI|nr:hypothetical protein Tdes44962_MAKER00584 [Teratosphaeria destructans]
MAQQDNTTRVGHDDTGIPKSFSYFSQGLKREMPLHGSASSRPQEVRPALAKMALGAIASVTSQNFDREQHPKSSNKMLAEAATTARMLSQGPVPAINSPDHAFVSAFPYVPIDQLDPRFRFTPRTQPTEGDANISDDSVHTHQGEVSPTSCYRFTCEWTATARGTVVGKIELKKIDAEVD